MSWPGGVTFQFTGASPLCAKCGGVLQGLCHGTADGRQWHATCLAAAQTEEQRRIDSLRATQNAAHVQKSALAIGGLRALFEACAPNNRLRLYKGLAAAFHPDVGGDDAIMAALNDAKERYCR